MTINYQGSRSTRTPASLSTVPELEEAEREVNSPTPTDIIVDKALRKLTYLEHDENRMLPHPSDLTATERFKRVDPYKLLKATLEWAPSERGRRYVALAISHCTDTDRLVGLSNTWIRYVLLPFKGNRTLPDYHNHNPMGHESDMIKLVRLREGYQCLLTEVYHTGAAPPNQDVSPLIVTHIIKRAVGAFDPEKDEGSLLTWRLLQKYAGWDENRTQSIIDKLAAPFNGMLLDLSYHIAWDNYAWTLKPAFNVNGEMITNTYDIDVIRPQAFPSSRVLKPGGLPINRRIVFKDHGTDSIVRGYMPEDDVRFINRSRPIPDPELITLHRSLCWVLHMSGAAEAIDSVFRDLEVAGSMEVPSRKNRTTDELDLLLSSFSLVAS